MIIGNCPYEGCDGEIWLPMADHLAWQKHVCETCHQTIWTLHSRMQPQSYTNEEFHMKFDVDEATKKITDKVVP